ncbi:unnamed protein product [Rotaria socialis]|uniref:Thioredoxin-like fold domain-containing protein n=2 Tax=Rotaria socialis TaxID=392032 RepID=A0A821RR80_9BILA|nr:unnamed protein product [Rotaria socialis]
MLTETNQLDIIDLSTSKFNESFFDTIGRIQAAVKITRLNIIAGEMFMGTLIEIIECIPAIDSLVISSLEMVPVRCLSTEGARTLRLLSVKNVITKVRLHQMNDLVPGVGVRVGVGVHINDGTSISSHPHTQFYKSYADAKSFEIIFLSFDRDQSAFDEYYGEMPWLALDFSERDKKKELSNKFNVDGIPTLILLNGDSGDIICQDARDRIEDNDPTGENFPWAS